jgi:RNA-directed DNA polymerase
MEQIGADASRESEQTSSWSFRTRKFGKPRKEAKQMAANTPAQTGMDAGAVSHEERDWDSIDWNAAHHNVCRLQMRLVKATKEKKWGKVKALQRLLTHSFSGKALAVRRVTENPGRKTPGVGGEIWTMPSQKARAIQELRQKGYHPKALRRVYIPKSSGKMRPLSMPCMKDRAMQALYLLALDPMAEVISDPNSYGFRQERSPADAIEQGFSALSRENSAQWILEADIKSCFDQISHKWLLAHIPREKAMLQKWLKTGFIEKHVLHATEEGTPQGGICSPVLANMTLNGLEKELREKFPKHPNIGSNEKINFVRFADDFIVTGKSKEVLENEVKPLVEQFMKERGLTLSQEKTIVTHIEDGFDCLGQHLRKYNGKLLSKPSKKNIHTFLEGIRTVIKENKQATAGNLIAQLNPKIRGWANYHRHVVSKETFNKVAHAIFLAVWQWARRRHPHKPHSWIKKKYFQSRGGQNWVFSGEILGREGALQPIRLMKASSMPIERHVKIRSEANPYDPEWETYFEKRLDVKMVHNLKGKRSLLHLWKQQGGLCPLCTRKITKLTGWHSHHMEWRSRGGKDQAATRVLLHPECHERLHRQGLTVSKPRPLRGVRKA